MLLPRLPVLSALLLLLLLLLLLAAGRCTAATLLRGSSTRADGRLDGRSMMELTGVRSPARVGRSYHGLEGHHRDPRHKDKFIRHLTGPLYFNPKCRKHFNRLYYNTRDCTVPAYYKRCARLLIQLANSPRCTER